MNRPSYGDRLRSLHIGIPALVAAAAAVLLGTFGLLLALLDLDSSSTEFVFWPLLLGLCVVTLGILLMRALARAVFAPNDDVNETL